MPKITVLGKGGIIWIIIALILLAKPKYRKAGVLTLAALTLGLILGNGIIKNVVARARPYNYSDIKLLVKTPWDYSFPSGHTLAAFSSAIVVTYHHRKMGWFMFPMAIIIAFSRMYLYVHFPSDILGAIVLSTLICIFTITVLGKCYDNYYPELAKKWSRK